MLFARTQHFQWLWGKNCYGRWPRTAGYNNCKFRCPRLFLSWPVRAAKVHLSLLWIFQIRPQHTWVMGSCQSFQEFVVHQHRRTAIERCPAVFVLFTCGQYTHRGVIGPWCASWVILSRKFGSTFQKTAFNNTVGPRLGQSKSSLSSVPGVGLPLS